MAAGRWTTAPPRSKCCRKSPPPSGGRVPILFDGGIRRGSDILKALALGATAVSLGRVPLWGLAAYGAQGVQKVLEILQAELVQAMAATGRPTLASIDKNLGKNGVPMSTPPSLIGEPPGRIAPARGLANTFEFEAMAQRSLSPAAFAGSPAASAAPSSASHSGRA